MIGESSAAETRMATEMPRIRGLAAATWSQFCLRVAATAGLLVIGDYLVALHDTRGSVNSLVVGGVAVIAALVELLFAPIAGALSDAHGRKFFLLAGPGLATLAVLLPPLGGLGAALPPLGLALALITLTRAIEGIGSALSVPATLSLLSEGTDAQPLRRGRQMSLYELASSGGIALGATLGPLLWKELRVSAFFVLALLYLAATLLVLPIREGGQRAPRRQPRELRRAVALLADRRLLLFTPAWIAINAILGVWVTAQIEFVLSARLHVAGQRFVGSLHGDEVHLSLLLGGYVLWFALCVSVWATFVGRLARLPTLLVTIFGSVVASAGLIALNHGGALPVFVPVVLVGVFLEAGFGPAALAYLADISQVFAEDRGLLMGLYSVILGAGQFIGNSLGGIFAQVAYFDGLVILTMLLCAVGMLAIAALILTQRAPDRAREAVS